MCLTYMSSLLLLCTVGYLINLLGKLFKVGDDKFFSESLSEQHDVVADTPTQGNTIEPVSLGEI